MTESYGNIRDSTLANAIEKPDLKKNIRILIKIKLRYVRIVNSNISAQTVGRIQRIRTIHLALMEQMYPRR